MPRFVILRHETPPAYPRPSHWDFMLEQDGVLWTWALPQPPSFGQAQTCEKLPDHRLAYLTFEGDVSNDRGTVRQWEAGEYDWVRQERHDLLVCLRGRQLIANARLTLPDNDQPWQFELSPPR